MTRAFIFVLLLAAGLTRTATALDLELYARLLERHTIAVDDVASTRVDYAALKLSAEWDRLVLGLEKSDLDRLETRESQLAFWINAYNILAIDLVRRNYPVAGIRSLGSLLSPVWKRDVGRIGGRARTLEEIEHRILRPMGDPRIHGAIVCASLSCPPLRREPYREAEIDAQLDDNVRLWLVNPLKGARIDRTTGTLWLSPIFDWFEDDFRMGVASFVARYVHGASAEWIEAQGSALRIRWLDYDWSLNDVATRPHAAMP